MNESRLFTAKGIMIIAIFSFLIAILSVILLLNNLVFQSLPVYILTVILFYLSLIMIFYGLHFLLKSKNEFNSNHKKSVTIGGKLIVFGILLYLFGKMFILPFFSGYPLLESVSNTVVGIPFLLALIYLVKEIAEINIRKILWIAFSLNIVINIPIQWMLYSNFYDSLIKIASGLSIALGLISIIPALIFVFCYYKTYQKIKEAIPLNL